MSGLGGALCDGIGVIENDGVSGDLVHIAVISHRVHDDDIVGLLGIGEIDLGTADDDFRLREGAPGLGTVADRCQGLLPVIDGSRLRQQVPAGNAALAAHAADDDFRFLHFCTSPWASATIR